MCYVKLYFTPAASFLLFTIANLCVVLHEASTAKKEQHGGNCEVAEWSKGIQVKIGVLLFFRSSVFSFFFLFLSKIYGIKFFNDQIHFQWVVIKKVPVDQLTIYLPAIPSYKLMFRQPKCNFISRSTQKAAFAGMIVPL